MVRNGNKIENSGSGVRSGDESGKVETTNRKLDSDAQLVLLMVEALKAYDENGGEDAKVDFLRGGLIFLAAGTVPGKR